MKWERVKKRAMGNLEKAENKEFFEGIRVEAL